MYSFLSQMFDYGNTAVEKRFLFFRRLMPLLEFGREREGVDLSKVTLTHHALRNLGKTALGLGDGESPKLAPLTEAGSGAINEKERARLAEIIARVNELFEGELTDDDQLVYVNNVIKGKLLESQELAEQAVNNTKAQFANSPTLSKETHERDHRGARRSHDDEQAGARLREGARGPEGRPARPGAALRGAAGEGGAAAGGMRHLVVAFPGGLAGPSSETSARARAVDPSAGVHGDNNAFQFAVCNI